MQEFHSNSRKHSAENHNFRTQRAGFSWRDLLAVTFVIGMLLLCVDNCVQPLRAKARRVQCLSNLKDITLGTQNFAVARYGELPYLEDGKYGWPVHLLPLLDYNDVYRQFTADPDSMALNWVRVLTCPDDQLNDRYDFGLSYLANAGYGNFHVDSVKGEIVELGSHSADIDWDGDGTIDQSDRAVSRASGLFWRKHEDGFRMTLKDIEQGDGLSQTILYSEDNSRERRWDSRSTLDLSFVIGRDAIGMSRPSGDNSPLRIRDASLGKLSESRFNSMQAGHWPAPGANHPSFFHVAFSDGSVRAFDEEIAPRVFARLMTPKGEALGQSPVGDDDF